jgi:hypothetical protein
MPDPTVDPGLPVEEVSGRTLDWRPRFDERSKAFRYGATQLPEKSRLWSAGPDVLDQGQEGACVGFACAGEAAASPVRVKRITDAYALGIYRLAQQKYDEWPGEAYSGTSVLAGCLAGRDLGLWSGFRWALSAEELAAAVAGLGPAVIGVEWREGSYDTDPKGVIHPSGRIVGGHALCVLGYLNPAHHSEWMKKRLIRLDLWNGLQSLNGQPAFCAVNSWGPSYGKNGLFLIPLDVMRAWVKGGAELAIPQQRKMRKTA